MGAFCAQLRWTEHIGSPIWDAHFFEWDVQRAHGFWSLSVGCSAFHHMDADLSEQVSGVCDRHWRWFDVLFSRRAKLCLRSRRCLRKRNTCCSLFLPKLSLLRIVEMNPVLSRSCLHQFSPLVACSPNAVGSGEASALPNRCCHRSLKTLFCTYHFDVIQVDGRKQCFSWTFNHSLSPFSRCLSHSNLERG